MTYASLFFFQNIVRKNVFLIVHIYMFNLELETGNMTFILSWNKNEADYVPINDIRDCSSTVFPNQPNIILFVAASADYFTACLGLPASKLKDYCTSKLFFL